MVPVSSPNLLVPTPVTLGRYEILGALARGGMATVYLGRHSGEAGFKRLYAIKVLHPHLADDGSFVDMLLDEARIAARLHHPNVVPIVDLGSQDGSHYVVMEYVEGCSLSALLAKYRDSRPPRLIVPLVLDALAGLDAAHSLTDDDGKSLGLVHRDVSPQNILVGVDGSARITDFGIAKAASKINSTQPGQLKGKLAFMAPEQLKNASNVDARTDVFAAGAMLWSALTGRRLFLGASDAETLNNVLTLEVPKPSTVGFQPPAELDEVCLRALEREPDKRYQTAAEMEDALRAAAEKAGVIGSKREVAEWLASAFGDELAERRAIIRGTDSSSRPSAASQISGFRVIPAVGASSLTPSGATQDEIPIETVDMPAAADGQRRKRIMIAAALGGAVLLAVVGFALHSSAPPAAAAATPPAPVTATATATATAPATVTVTAKPPETETEPEPPPPASAAAAHGTAKTTATPAPTGKTPTSPARVTAAPPWTPPAAKSAKAATPGATPTPPAAEPRKKSWDSDSPLPPQ
jgi:serine/threonine protein kinase